MKARRPESFPSSNHPVRLQAAGLHVPRRDKIGSGVDVVVSNRLPTAAQVGDLAASPGGLVAALSAALQAGSRWIGIAGDPSAPSMTDVGGMCIERVDIDEHVYADYYNGACNSVLWPLFHGRLQPVELSERWWRAYVHVNRQVAARTAAVARPWSTVWVHDYQLMLVPRLLRNARPDLRIGFFLHIPFPAHQTLALLPWRRTIVEGLDAADLVGFQTCEDLENFEDSRDRLGRSARGALSGAAAGVFPVSVDFDAWDERGRASLNEATAVRRDLGDCTLLLGVDRLDYTKGIRHRIEAFGRLLDAQRTDRECVLVQVAMPSRTDVSAYRRERRCIEDAAARVNARHRRRDGSPAVVLIHDGLGADELATWYRAADCLVVTSLADGMNLVAKEFVAARGDLQASVVLSQFTGAAAELEPGALLVNPYYLPSIEHGMARALAMTDAERARRMEAMREVVRHHDVTRWADTYLRRLRNVCRDRVTCDRHHQPIDFRSSA